MANNVKVSIIVPIYNAEKYLNRCIDSILNQTLKDIEVILVNDGSRDKSLEIMQNYQKEYPNIIKLITIENSGAANARNVGITLAQGEYVGFVDSDDYVDINMYEKMYKKAKKENSEMVVSAYFIQKGDKKTSRQKGHLEQYNQNVLENPNIFIYGVPYLWNKIFKKDLIETNDIKFGKLRIFEDLEFVYKLYIKANKISKVDEELYYYVKDNEQSLTARFNSKFLDIIPAIKHLKQYYIENNCYEILEDRVIYTALKHIYIRCKMNVQFKDLKLKFDYINKVFEFLNQEFPNWKTHKFYFDIKNKNQKKYTSKIYWKAKNIINAIKK